MNYKQLLVKYKGNQVDKSADSDYEKSTPALLNEAWGILLESKNVRAQPFLNLFNEFNFESEAGAALMQPATEILQNITAVILAAESDTRADFSRALFALKKAADINSELRKSFEQLDLKANVDLINNIYRKLLLLSDVLTNQIRVKNGLASLTTQIYDDVTFDSNNELYVKMEPSSRSASIEKQPTIENTNSTINKLRSTGNFYHLPGATGDTSEDAARGRSILHEGHASEINLRGMQDGEEKKQATKLFVADVWNHLHSESRLSPSISYETFKKYYHQNLNFILKDDDLSAMVEVPLDELKEELDKILLSIAPNQRIKVSNEKARLGGSPQRRDTQNIVTDLFGRTTFEIITSDIGTRYYQDDNPQLIQGHIKLTYQLTEYGFKLIDLQGSNSTLDDLVKRAKKITNINQLIPEAALQENYHYQQALLQSNLRVQNAWNQFLKLVPTDHINDSDQSLQTKLFKNLKITSMKDMVSAVIKDPFNSTVKSHFYEPYRMAQFESGIESYKVKLAEFDKQIELKRDEQTRLLRNQTFNNFKTYHQLVDEILKLEQQKDDFLRNSPEYLLDKYIAEAQAQKMIELKQQFSNAHDFYDGHKTKDAIHVLMLAGARYAVTSDEAREQVTDIMNSVKKSHPLEYQAVTLAHRNGLPMSLPFYGNEASESAYKDAEDAILRDAKGDLRIHGQPIGTKGQKIDRPHLEEAMKSNDWTDAQIDQVFKAYSQQLTYYPQLPEIIIPEANQAQNHKSPFEMHADQFPDLIFKPSSDKTTNLHIEKGKVYADTKLSSITVTSKDGYNIKLDTSSSDCVFRFELTEKDSQWGFVRHPYDFPDPALNLLSLKDTAEAKFYFTPQIALDVAQKNIDTLINDNGHNLDEVFLKRLHQLLTAVKKITVDDENTQIHIVRFYNLLEAWLEKPSSSYEDLFQEIPEAPKNLGRVPKELAPHFETLKNIMNDYSNSLKPVSEIKAEQPQIALGKVSTEAPIVVAPEPVIKAEEHEPKTVDGIATPDEIHTYNLNLIVLAIKSLYGRVSLFGGELVIDDAGNERYLPKHAAKMLEVHTKAVNQGTASKDVLENLKNIAKEAANYKKHGFFNSRDVVVQQFYDSVRLMDIGKKWEPPNSLLTKKPSVSPTTSKQKK